jgi:Flp pilus assembly protein TadG
MKNLIKGKVQTAGKTWRNEVGGALVEAALTAPVLVTMLLGMVELGRVAYIAIETSNAARAAVSYGSQNSLTASDTGGMTSVAQLEASGLASQNVNLSVSAVGNCACSSPDTTVTPFACADASTALCPDPSFVEQTLNVTVTATFDPIIHVKGLVGPFTIYGHAKQKRLNN